MPGLIPPSCTWVAGEDPFQPIPPATTEMSKSLKERRARITLGTSLVLGFS